MVLVISLITCFKNKFQKYEKKNKPQTHIFNVFNAECNFSYGGTYVETNFKRGFSFESKDDKKSPD